MTPQAIFGQRRILLKLAGLKAAGAVTAGLLWPLHAQAQGSLPDFRPTAYGKEEKLTGYEDITGYNNYYEFSTGKED